MRNMDDFEVGYVSGILDGEGCMDLTNKRISITNTSKELLEFLQGIVGGRIYLHHPSRSRAHPQGYTDQHGYIYKKCWRLNIHLKKEIDDVLQAVIPHLREPKRHGDALRLLSLNSVRKAKGAYKPRRGVKHG